MGVVYEAHDSVIDRKVAIKLVRADLLHGDERQDYVERFQREARRSGAAIIQASSPSSTLPCTGKTRF